MVGIIGMLIIGISITGYCFYLISKGRWLKAFIIWITCGIISGMYFLAIYMTAQGPQIITRGH